METSKADIKIAAGMQLAASVSWYLVVMVVTMLFYGNRKLHEYGN